MTGKRTTRVLTRLAGGVLALLRRRPAVAHIVLDGVTVLELGVGVADDVVDRVSYFPVHRWAHMLGWLPSLVWAPRQSALAPIEGAAVDAEKKKALIAKLSVAKNFDKNLALAEESRIWFVDKVIRVFEGEPGATDAQVNQKTTDLVTLAKTRVTAERDFVMNLKADGNKSFNARAIERFPASPRRNSLRRHCPRTEAGRERPERVSAVRRAPPVPLRLPHVFLGESQTPGVFPLPVQVPRLPRLARQRRRGQGLLGKRR